MPSPASLPLLRPMVSHPPSNQSMLAQPIITVSMADDNDNTHNAALTMLTTASQEQGGSKDDAVLLGQWTPNNEKVWYTSFHLIRGAQQCICLARTRQLQDGHCPQQHRVLSRTCSSRFGPRASRATALGVAQKNPI
jgi:hypothetical protein